MLAELGVYLELCSKLHNNLQVPIHLRTNWDSFYLEMLMLAGLGVYFLICLYLKLFSKLHNILQVPIHLRTNWDSFYLEMLMLAGLGVYFSSFFI